MLTTASGAPVAYSSEEADFLVALSQGLFTPDGTLRTALSRDKGLGVLAATDKVTVVGHSLGGHLAQTFFQMFPLSVEAGYTFNAPGFGGVLTEVVERLLRPGTTLDIPVSAITNVIANHGPDVTAGLGAMLGGTIRLFNEQSLLPIDDHFIAKLSDSLTLYDLFQRIDPNVVLSSVSDILDAATNIASRSLETSLDTARALLAVPGSASLVSTEIGNRETYYENVLGLHSRVGELAGMSSLGVASLVRMAPGAVSERALAADGAAYRYALDRLLPVAVTGIDYDALVRDESLRLASDDGASGTMTSRWIRDRALMNAWIIARNVQDGGSTLRRTDGGAPVTFTWATGGAADNVLRVVDNVSALASQVAQVYFGGTETDTFSGSGKDDALYGSPGDDRLDGRGGNDYLQGDAGADVLSGGEGADTLVGGPGDDVLEGGPGQDRLVGGPGVDRYVLAAGSADTIEDADGRGIVLLDGVQFAGGSGERGVFWNADRTLFATFAGPLSDTGALRINSEVTILGFRNGDFGINLAETITEEAPDTPAFAYHYDNSPLSVEEQGLRGTVENGSQYEERFPYGSTENDAFQAGPDWGPYFFGRAGDDVLDGGFGLARLYGGSGNDVITGGLNTTGERDRAFPTHKLAGEGGQDEIFGSDEADSIYGDFFSVHLGTETTSSFVYEIDGTSWRLPKTVGQDGQFLRWATDTFPYSIDVASVFFRAPDLGADPQAFIRYMIGDSSTDEGYFDDTLYGNGGDDSIQGGPGNDAIYGGAGNDILDGDFHNFGRDFDFGGVPEFERLFGKVGDDYIEGGEGDDEIDDVGGPNSVILAGPGSDQISVRSEDPDFGPVADSIGSTGYAWIDGGEGDDHIAAFMPHADIDGGDGNDVIWAEAISATATAGTGDDHLSATAVFAQMDGGPGSDSFLVLPVRGTGSYLVSNEGAQPGDFDQLTLPFSPEDYDFFQDGNDLVMALDPGLADAYEVAVGAAPLRVTLADWFSGPQFRIDAFLFWGPGIFLGSGTQWTADDVELALFESDGVFADIAERVDTPFDPGEPAPAWEEAATEEPIAEDTVSEETEPIAAQDESTPAPAQAVQDAPSDPSAPRAAGLEPAPVQDAVAADSVAEPAEAAAPPAAQAIVSPAASTVQLASSLRETDSAPRGTGPDAVSVVAFAPPPAPPAKNTNKPDDEVSDAGTGAPVSDAVGASVVALFAQAQSPALTSQEWLDAWYPAGARSGGADEARRSAISPEAMAPEVPVAPESAPLDPMPGEGEPLAPEEVARRYEAIDAWLATQADAGSDDTGAAFDGMPLHPFGSVPFSDAALSLAGMRFGATPGMAILSTSNLRSLEGLAEGFARVV